MSSDVLNTELSEYSEDDLVSDDSPVYKNTKRGHEQVNGTESDENEIENDTRDESFPITNLLCIIAAVVFAICSIYYTYAKNQTDIDGLKQIFPNQPNETFENFEAIIDDILSKKEIHPAVFLFLYDSNESEVNNLVHHLAQYAIHKLQTYTDYIDVPKNEFHTVEADNDYGYLLDKYRLDLLEKKVMVVKDLQNIPGHVAQVFHSFCDEISPLVEKVVYIFTLKVDTMDGKEEKIAELNLKMFWNNLDNDILMPLITRVTSTVLKVLK